ncbi:MAG: AAA family ATPase, partial [Acidimicrobiales bacterium]
MSDVVRTETIRPSPIPGVRYLPLRVLKDGGGVTTILAIDTESGLDVVVKRVDPSAVSASTRMRLEHESAVLQRLDSRRLASIIDVVSADDALCLVLPLAPGQTLAERLAEGPLSVDDALAVATELFRALAVAHGIGVVHRDVKPANVMVDGTPPDLQLTLVDFGLARAGWYEGSGHEEPVGTARYVSPEQAGLLHHDVDERADLYSAGAVIFECIAGRPPFNGASVGEVLRAHATTSAPHLRSLGNEVPGALDEIVQRLLRKDPRDRYQTAAAVVTDLEQLVGARGAGVADPSIVIGVHDERQTLTEPAFVGRRAELAALDAEVDRARRGHGGLVLLEAESGGGKSRVLDELAQRSGAAGTWVLRGQGLDHAATLPFQMLTGVAEAIAAEDREVSAAFAGRIADHADGVRSALPALVSVLPGSGTDLGPAEFGRARVDAALSALLDALGEEDRPALVLLDDCQWADEPTLRVVERWASEPRPAMGRSVMVVAAFRSEEVGPDHALRRTAARLTLRLSPFGVDDVRGLVESMAGPLPDRAVSVVEDLAAGSPFMASAVLRGLVEVGALVREGDAWEVDDAAIADVQSSRRAAAFLTRRLRLLPAGSRALLTVGAVLGKEFELDLAATLAGQDAGEAVAAVDEARRRHILWAAGRRGRYAFVHDKLRETLLADVAPNALAELHRRAAEHLEGEVPRAIFELGYHFDAAGQPERALPYALAAGDEARSRHALEVAERQYLVAARGAGTDRRSSLRVALGLGEILLLQGRYAAAGEKLETARALAEDAATRGEIAWRMGELAFKRGDVREAGSRLEEAHRLMGRRPPQHAVTYLVRLVWEVLVQVTHTLWPERLGRRDPVKGAADLAAARVYSRMAYAYWFSRGRVPTAWAHLRGMNIAERYPPGPELAQAWSEHAPVMTVIPLFARALTYAERSLAIREDLGDVWGQGQSLHFHGVALYAASRYEECIEKCRMAVRLLQRTGDQWEVHTATWHIAFSLYRLGQLDAAVATAQRVHRSGVELGDHQAAGIGLGAWSKAAAGNLPAELVEAALARTRDDVHTSAEVLQAEALRLIGAGQVDDAVAILGEADALVRRSGLRQEYVSPVVAWLTTAQRLQVEALGPWAPRQRRQALRRAQRTARRARRTAFWYRNNQPHVLREAGLLAALAGRDHRAQKLLARSLAIADEQGARHERAQTLLARGRVGVLAGWPGAGRDDVEGTALAAELRREPLDEGATPSLSLVDRFERLLDEGRRVAGALTAPAVYETLHDAAEVLLRPQACRVVELVDGWRALLAADGETSDPFVSGTLIERAVALGRPVSS